MTKLLAADEAAPPAILERLVVVRNKSDLPSVLDQEAVARRLPGVPQVPASALAPDGTQALEAALTARVLRGQSARSDVPLVTSVRHRDALLRAADHVASALASSATGTPAAFVAVDLHGALNALGEITGETVGEDLLDMIFREFCIGK